VTEILFNTFFSFFIEVKNKKVLTFAAQLLTIQKLKNMALPIRAIPVLEGKVATRFLREMKKAEKERGTIDISENIKAARALWERSKENFVKR